MSASSVNKRVDMLHGNLLRAIIAFALPLVASGVLQQSFNSIDVAVVGRFVSHRALGAVGSNGPVISLIINLFVGISIGANVVIANSIGRRDKSAVRRAVSSTMLIAVVSGILLLLLGLSVASPILSVMGTPDDILAEAVVYLRIYTVGFPFMMIYNFGAAILRATGDTRRPFYALVAGGILNVALNLLLVLVVGLGVEGVAIGTVAANVLSAAIIVVMLMREHSDVRLDWHEVFSSRPAVRRILAIGVPAGVQGMVFSLSNVFIQSAINSFGSAAVAGSAAAINYEYYCYFVISAFAQATVAFTGANYGAGHKSRCRKIFRTSLTLSFISCGILNVAIVILHYPAIEIFTTSPEVAEFAYKRLFYVLAFQFIASSYEIAGASLRGIGNSMTPMLLTIFGTCVLRLAWVFAVARGQGDFGVLLAIYPLSWALTGVMVVIAYLRSARRNLTVNMQCKGG